MIFNTFNTFREIIIKELKVRLGDGYEVAPHDAYKNNLSVVKGVSIRKNGSPVAPVIYLENAYKEFMSDDIKLQDVIELILRMKDAKAMDNVVVDTVNLFQEWESAKAYVKPRLINTERNQEFLMRTPHLAFHDLSVIFCLEFELGEEEASITVTDKFLEMYGTNVTEIYEQALCNLDKEDIRLRTMIETFLDLDAPEEILEEALDDRTIDMCVLSKADACHAAAAILLPRVRDLIVKKMNGPVYILPSSRHELIIVPKSDMYEPDKMLEMVKEVNMTLNPEDYLADSVYLLNSEREFLKVA